MMTEIKDLTFNPVAVYRARRYTIAGGRWRTWYELCPVIKITKSTVIVRSEDYPDTPLYPGGTFHLNRFRLAKGCCYHSKHGEYFFLEAQDDAWLFPSQDILNTPPQLEQELKELGWCMPYSDHEFSFIIEAIRRDTSLFLILPHHLLP